MYVPFMSASIISMGLAKAGAIGQADAELPICIGSCLDCAIVASCYQSCEDASLLSNLEDRTQFQCLALIIQPMLDFELTGVAQSTERA